MNFLLKAREARGLRKSDVPKGIAAFGVKIHRADYGRIEARIDARIKAARNGNKNLLSPTTPAKADALAKFFGNAVTRDQILYPEDYATNEQKSRKAA